MNKDREKYIKENCYFLYDDVQNRYKSINEIQQNFKCQIDNKGRKRLYVKNKNKDEYDFISKTELKNKSCFLSYDNYLNPEVQDRRKQLLENALETNCSKNIFQDINPQYNKLLNYSYKLAEELHVDSLIKRFIIDLILYTNINEFGLQELYKGAFIIIRDGGFFYKRYKCPDRARICDITKLVSESSHDSLSKDPQYRIGNGVIYNCSEDGTCNRNSSNNVFDLLVGTSPNPNFYGDTWIQFEYANLLTPWNKWGLHTVSFIKHFFTKKNIGPLGESNYAEYTKPLIFNICKDPKCKNNTCNPVQCVRPESNLQIFTDNFLKDNKINMQDYEKIKDMIKKRFKPISNNIFIQNIIDICNGYIEAHNEIDLTIAASTSFEINDMFEKMLPYLNYLAETDNFKYNREQIIEIMFLIYYYINTNNTNYTELKREIDKRYSTTRQTAGKKNKRKTRSLKKNKKKTKKIRN